jgi:hypothetical protein
MAMNEPLAKIGTFSAPSLSRRQRGAIRALLEAKSVKEAAEKAKVAYSTLRTWLDDRAFRDALDDAQSFCLSEALSILAGGAAGAAATLRQMAEGETEAKQGRMAACVRLIELNNRLKVTLSNESRYKRLERARKAAEERKRPYGVA